MSDNKTWKFIIGKKIQPKKAESPVEYLETAEKVHAFLTKHQYQNKDGIYWIDSNYTLNSELKIEDLSYYVGSSGLAYFYLQLYSVTHKNEYRDIALGAADYLDRNWKKQYDVLAEDGPLVSENPMYKFETPYSIYTGVTSIGMVLAQFYKVFHRENDLEAVREITDAIIGASKSDESGIYWCIDPCFLYDSGILVYLCKISEYLDDPKILETAARAADAILAKAIHDERGGLAWTSYAHPGQTRVPNFECGTAGIGYALTIVYEYTRQKKYLDAAVEAAKHLKAIAIQQGDGFLIPWHDNPEEEPIFYVSSCHGPAGTSKLFYRLYILTGSQQYLDDVRGLYLGLKHLGVPQRQSAGYWNTTNLCCGTAGVLQFLINYSMVTGDENAKEDAIMAGDILLGTLQEQDEGIAWPLAFERIHPTVITKSIAYGTGSAGVASALMQLYLFLEDRYEWNRLFDDPWPEKQTK